MSKQNITIIGAGGTIGLSLSALFLRELPPTSHLTVLDPKPEIADVITTYLARVLPASYHSRISDNLTISTAIADAVNKADIVYEAGPESLEFKSTLWPEVERHAPRNCLFWSATTGIPASKQNSGMYDKRRLIVVHCFNPPHILPLIELVPSPETDPEAVKRTLSWWCEMIPGRDPIVIKKEIPGFVAGRLAWALLREAISLVDNGVVDVTDVDKAIEGSMGIRWAYQGPFKSFHAGGGAAGFEGLMKNVGGTVQKVWDDLGEVRFGKGQWEQKVYSRCEENYGLVDQKWMERRDEVNARILKAVNAEGIGREDAL